MIQAIQKNSATPFAQVIHANILSEMTSIDYFPLIEFKSQLSKKSLFFRPVFFIYGLGDRYVMLFYYTWNEPTASLFGYLKMGTTDYPYGLYDVTIYQNSSSGNLDPANAVKTLWNGLMNLTQSGNPAVEYKDYNTNDTDTESVYITF